MLLLQSVHRYRQTLCHVVTPTWAGACLVTAFGVVALQCRFIVAGVVCVRPDGCGWSNEGCRRWWLLVAVVVQQRWVDHRGGREQKCLFVHDAHVSFRQTPLTQLSKREGCRLCKIIM